jgi:protein-disulfide isomerase
MMRKAKYGVGVVAALLSCPLVAAGGRAEQSKTVATVGGVAISENEVAEQAREELQKVEEQRLEVLGGRLDSMIEQRLTELEAKQRGIAVAELVRREVTAKTTDPTDAEVDAFYEGAKERMGRPKEEMAPQIRTYLLNQRRQAAHRAFLATLRGKYPVHNFLQEERQALELARAETLRKLVEPGDAPSRGPAQAPVTVVEFSDFECPFCGRVEPTLERLVTDYGQQVRLVYRQFPLTSIHRNAQKAAEASLCAADQGKFWEYHDLLFQDQQKLAVAELKEKAQRLGLDAPRFAACLDGGTQAERVRQESETGSRAGVSGTPALFVNGRLISGAVPYEQLAQAVKEEIERQSKVAAAGTK